MMLKRLRSFSLRRGRSRRDGDSLGESLRDSECFTVEIPNVLSDKAIRDSGFFGSALPVRPGVGINHSSSTVSTLTTYSGSARTSLSRSSIEYKGRSRRAHPSNERTTVNSIIYTRDGGREFNYRKPGRRDGKKGDLARDFACGVDLCFICENCLGRDEEIDDEPSDAARVDDDFGEDDTIEQFDGEQYDGETYDDRARQQPVRRKSKQRSSKQRRFSIMRRTHSLSQKGKNLAKR